MTATVFSAVIFAAIIHSIWNGMIKKHEDKYNALAALVLGHIPLSIIVLFFTPMISIKSIPYIFISSVFLAGYEWCLLSAYRLEDYTKVYPIAFGLIVGHLLVNVLWNVYHWTLNNSSLKIFNGIFSEIL